MSTTLTWGDILAFCGIALAIQAATFGVTFYLIGNGEKIRKNIEELHRSNIFLNSLIISLLEVIESIKAVDKFTEGETTRLFYSSTLDQSMIKGIISSHKQLLDELDKNGWELSMYSEKENVRLSAFRNLSELGNIETIDKMDQVIKFNINNISAEERKLFFVKL